MTEWEKYCLSQEVNLQKMFPNANLKNPKTLTDKLQWLKIHDSTMLKAYCADKITLRDYCTEKLGKDICIPILAVYEKPEQIEWDKLPEKFVIKCNHGSAMNIIVKNKNTVNKQNINKQLKNWLSCKYGNLSLELFYNLISPKIFHSCIAFLQEMFFLNLILFDDPLDMAYFYNIQLNFYSSQDVNPSQEMHRMF